LGQLQNFLVVFPQECWANLTPFSLKGWLAVDVASILPVGPIGALAGAEGAEDTGAQLRALKTLRLFRLVKLLKLVRGMRLYKKYEDQFGPSINVGIMLLLLLLVMHTICCCWYFLGARSARGWCSHHFEDARAGGEMCGCLGTDFSWDFGLRACMNAVDDEASSGACTAAPANVDLYFASMWNVIHPPLDDPLSGAEMVAGMILVYVVGATFGSMAGAFSTLFASHALAKQMYAQKVDTVKSFCKLKHCPPRPGPPSALNLKFTGLTQNLGQLQGSFRDFQSNCWVNLRILGQPCELYLLGLSHSESVLYGAPLGARSRAERPRRAAQCRWRSSTA
jgi:hypothetical protein